MAQVHWTGHPFVDAGWAAIAAITEVEDLSQISGKHLEAAVEALERVLLSDQAMGIEVPNKAKAFVKGPLSQLFPNSELVNPSNWKNGATSARQRFQEAVRDALGKVSLCLKKIEQDERCLFCGELRPRDSMTTVRKDKVPLLEGIVNFYPALTHGVPICGLCLLAVRFLPLSVMRTGVYNRLWFLHTQVLSIASRVAHRYGWDHLHGMLAGNEPLDFYSRWETAGDAGTVLYLLFELLETFGSELRKAYESPLPTTAYIFSNDNRGGFVQPIPIPNELLRFFARLQARSLRAFRLFWQELLNVSAALEGKARENRVRFVSIVARRLVNTEFIVGQCLDHDTPKLIGGWMGHRLYLQEVRNMPMSRLAILERLGLRIAQSEDAKRHTIELRKAERGQLRALLLRYVREGWLAHDEFYMLLPPNDYSAAQEVRDILLAVIYEWQYCQERGEEFPYLQVTPTLQPDEILHRIQEIGKNLLGQLSNVSRWIGQLQTARSSDRIRATYLTAIRQGALGFQDFLFLAPLGDRAQMWLLRDYLLAYMFDQAWGSLPEEEEIGVSEQPETV